MEPIRETKSHNKHHLSPAGEAETGAAGEHPVRNNPANEDDRAGALKGIPFPSNIIFVALDLTKIKPLMSCRDLNSNRVLIQTIGG